MRLFVLRHEKRDPVDPSFASPLLPAGHADAARLATTLCATCPTFTHVYSSPFPRCVQTIAPYCVATGTRVRCEYALYERIQADAGHDRDAFRLPWTPGVYPELDACVDTRATSWGSLDAVTWGETETAVRARTQAFVAHLHATHRAEDVVLLVTHLSVLNAVRGAADDAAFPMGGVVEVHSAV